jgi:hypothetical protein
MTEWHNRYRGPGVMILDRAAADWGTGGHDLVAQAFHGVEQVELGAGLHSTPAFLDRTVFPDLDEVVSLETDEGWARRVQDKVGDDPRLKLRVITTEMSEAIPGIDLHGVDLVLIDDSDRSEQRARTIAAVA